MTVIKLDPATLAQFQAAEGSIVLADESGKPMRLCVLPSLPMTEPELSPEEWKRRMRPEGGMTTSQMLDYFNRIATS
jgi:hypothetical protein